MKASSSTRRPTLWFFLTDKRVGNDLAVDDASGMLSQDELRGQLDPDEYYTTSASYARGVAKDLFGNDDVRYRNLCHLLYELRRPSVGEKIEEGDLTNVLTEALPPLDDELIENVARNFDDLSKIREDLARAEKTERALAEFLDAYSDYTRGVVRNRAGSVVAAADEANAFRRGLRRAEADAERTRGDADDAQAAVDDLEAMGRNAHGELQVLLASPAYQSLQAITDRKARVEAFLATAKVADEAADRARRHERKSAETVTTAAGKVDTETGATAATRRELEPWAMAAGVDVALLPEPVVAPERSAEVIREEVVHRVEGREVVRRLLPRRLDVDTANAAATAHQEQTATLSRLVEERNRNATELIAEGDKVERAWRTTRRAEEERVSAEERLENAREAEAAAVGAATEEDHVWRNRLRTWVADAVGTGFEVDWGPVADYARFEDDTDLLSIEDLDIVAATVEHLLAAPRQAVATAVTAARVTKQNADTALTKHARRQAPRDRESTREAS